MKKELLVFANAAVALLLIFLFVQSMGAEKIADSISKAKPEFLLIGALFYAAMNLLNSFRIAWAIGKPWNPSLFFMHMTAMLISDFTPGRAGYSSLVLKLRARGVESGAALKSLGLVFATDFFARALIAAAAVLFFAQWADATLFGLVAGAMLLLGGAMVYLLAFQVKALYKLLGKIPLFGVRLQGAYESALAYKTEPSFLGGNVLLALAGALLRGAGWTFAFIALGFGTLDAIWVATLVSALVTTLSFVPVSLAGIGLQEGAGAYLFSIAVAITIQQAAAVMLAARVMEFGVDALLGWKELTTGWKKQEKNQPL